MTKKELIWLVIRFFGVLKLILIPRVVSRTSINFVTTYIFLCGDSSMTAFAVSGLLITTLNVLVYVLIVLYLMFFGKAIFNLIHRTSAKAPDAVLEKQDHTEILIRFVGFWWLWMIIARLGGFLLYGSLTLILSHPQWFPPESRVAQAIKDCPETLQKMLSGSLSWDILFSILLYAILAFYFLKHGKFFINLLNRLWLKKTNQGLIQNPDGLI